MKKSGVILLVIVLLLQLTGCMRTVDKMYQLPKRSDDYIDLQVCIDKAMSGMDYFSPLNGDNQQTVQMTDLDGDGVQEYLVFAKSAHEKPLRILVFREISNTFFHTDTIECNGSAFDQVEYVDMDGNGGMEIVVGRQLNDQIIRSVSVYAMKDSSMVQLLGTTYTKFLTSDLDNDLCFELFVVRPGDGDTENGIAELYSMKRGVMERYNEVPLSRPADKLKRIIIGRLFGGTSAVFTACDTDDNGLVTDIFALSGGRMRNVTIANEAETAVQTLRNFYVYADDIDNDSVVELPSLITMKPMDDSVAADTHQLIRWYALTPNGQEVVRMFTFHNFVGGWFLQLDREWAHRLVVRNMGEAYEFYMWDEAYASTQKVLTIYAHTSQNREIQSTEPGHFLLLKTDSTIYSAMLETCAADFGLTQDNVIYRFRLIQKDWKTGEM